VKKIVFVTGNKLKILHANEVLSIFGYEVRQKKVEMIEPREEDPEKVVVEKARQAYEKLKMPLIVEDSGIFIKALGGFPKTFVKFTENTIGITGILKLMEGQTDRMAEFRQSLAYISPDNPAPEVFSYIDGGYMVATKIWDGENGDFGFNKILIPPGENKPLCTFSKQWCAKRDARANKGKIHYEQLARWLAK
jgi:XTP/dITP diphosphohydrolase